VKILALDTATENCSAALLVGEQLTTREVELERGHAERILPMIDELLAGAHLALTDLDAIAFGRGPGSFTGVRLAATVTQGLAFGAARGVVPISDLQAVAQRAFATDPAITRVLVCNDARMSEVYWACYARGADGLARLEGEERVGKPSEVRLPPAWPDATAVGRGFAAYGEVLRVAVPQVLPSRSAPAAAMPSGASPQAAPKVPPSVGTPTAPSATAGPFAADPLMHLLPRAQEIALLAVPLVSKGQLLPPEAAIPIYLRDNVAHVAR
jgi:tRNA threonylcarbamoyladenosine biosynthesis protein TsaB